MKKRIYSLLFAGILAVTLLAGCGNKNGGDGSETAAGGESEPVESNSGSSPEENGEDSYNFVTNTWGTGAYALDTIITIDKYFCEQFDINLDVANNEFTADKVIGQLESQLANDPDGVLFCGVAAPTFDPVAKACEKSQTPYVFQSNFPEESVLNDCLESDYFCGAILAGSYEMGYQLGEQAISDGHRTAVLTAAALGDYTHDNRIAGFTDAFEAGGGKVLQVSHSSDPSEAVTKTNDLLTANPTVDCIYGVGGDYGCAAISVLQQRGDMDCAVYASDMDPTLLEGIKNGECVAANGGHFVDGSLAMTLLVNYLDGHPILDENGKAPCFSNLTVFTVNQENIDKFLKFFDSGENLISRETYEKLLYRYNPDVNVETYNEVLEGYADSVYKMLGIE